MSGATALARRQAATSGRHQGRVIFRELKDRIQTYEVVHPDTGCRLGWVRFAAARNAWIARTRGSEDEAADVVWFTSCGAAAEWLYQRRTSIVDYAARKRQS